MRHRICGAGDGNAWGADRRCRRAATGGYLAALRDVKTTRDRLDNVDGDLTIEARQMMGDGNQVIYGFSVAADGEILLSGRATVILEAA